MGPDALAHVLQPLAGVFGADIPNLLVGLGSADDAAVYQINQDQAIVATTDFFPPVVDDPYSFGAIAAANALSDIYAMGGTPLFCLNLVGFPDNLDLEILADILRGGADKVRESGGLIAGGHTVTDHEPKYGLAAIGIVHPDRIWTKGGARPGDVLLLTKPLGTGVITTALKNQAAAPPHVTSAVLSMTRLNAAAATALRSSGVVLHACTDVTGFGLLGHALEMAEQSGTSLIVQVSTVPRLPGALEYAAAGHVPGGTARNRHHLAGQVRFHDEVSELLQVLLSDPQTSGGLLAAVTADSLENALGALGAADVPAVAIGRVVEYAGVGARLVVEA
jgi:selenide, water dikinase